MSKIFYASILFILIFYVIVTFSCEASLLRQNLITRYSPLRVKNTVQAFSDKEFVLRHQALLARLTEQQRKVLTLLYIGNKTPEEIAAELKITQPAVSQHKTSGIEKLRELVDPDKALVLRHQALLTRLSKRQQRVLTLLYIGNKTPKEIVAELKITRQAVSQHKTSGIENLRELVEARVTRKLTSNQRLLRRAI